MHTKNDSPPWPALILIALILLFCAGCDRAHSAPAFSGELRVGAATPSAFDFGAGDTVFGVEGILKASHIAGPLSASVSGRHFAGRDSFALGKSRLKANLDIDIGRSASLFAELEYAYRRDTDRTWGWSGVRFRF